MIEGVLERLSLDGLLQTEVENLDRAVLGELEVRGLEVAVDDFSCAASRPSAVCVAMATASSTGIAPESSDTLRILSRSTV